MRKQKYASIVAVCGIVVLMLGCSESKQAAQINTSYMYTAAFKDNVYGITNEEIGVKQVDRFLGETQGVVSPKVSRNGEMSCRVSECAPPPGNKFYTIKEMDSNQMIAIESPSGNSIIKYYKCVYIGGISS